MYIISCLNVKKLLKLNSLNYFLNVLLMFFKIITEVH